MPKTLADIAKRWLTRRPESLSESERGVLQSTLDRRTISRDINAVHEHKMSTGERIADTIARVGGSWSFIISFLVFLAIWTVANTLLLAREAFDPYPFIFLNLVLSMIAAIQAPVIMMSQNRQAERDRLDASHDYEVNLKAEIEIMALHEKFDDIRHQEILAMRDEIGTLRAVLERIESRLPEAGRPA
ncbi:DUF1003 domain-containing protein [Mesorhizobium sp. LHD-90]|uniref:DUF1003 domain-containing protein n=1 Tax=Mesorhizobium sp. LHD-90 TaxID=3071414 RepID=UPI0027E0EA5C|nr:DUF1003 domain-containing protein [Mesorhizobium sp. LHD-90]MDQ6437739.1 DUF1003 domain-containing protein [Mesorhizobium sp. LHD-90]